MGRTQTVEIRPGYSFEVDKRWLARAGVPVDAKLRPKLTPEQRRAEFIRMVGAPPVNRRKSEAFKAHVMHLVEKDGYIKAVQILGIPHNTIKYWRRLHLKKLKEAGSTTNNQVEAWKRRKARARINLPGPMPTGGRRRSRNRRRVRATESSGDASLPLRTDGPCGNVRRRRKHRADGACYPIQ